MKKFNYIKFVVNSHTECMGKICTTLLLFGVLEKEMSKGQSSDQTIIIIYPSQSIRISPRAIIRLLPQLHIIMIMHPINAHLTRQS